MWPTTTPAPEFSTSTYWRISSIAWFFVPALQEPRLERLHLWFSRLFPRQIQSTSWSTSTRCRSYGGQVNRCSCGRSSSARSSREEGEQWGSFSDRASLGNFCTTEIWCFLRQKKKRSSSVTRLRDGVAGAPLGFWLFKSWLRNGTSCMYIAKLFKLVRVRSYTSCPSWLPICPMPAGYLLTRFRLIMSNILLCLQHDLLPLFYRQFIDRFHYLRSWPTPLGGRETIIALKLQLNATTRWPLAKRSLRLYPSQYNRVIRSEDLLLQRIERALHMAFPLTNICVGGHWRILKTKQMYWE